MAIPSVGQYITFAVDGYARIYHYTIGSSVPSLVGTYRWLPAGLNPADFQILATVNDAGQGANMNIINSIQTNMYIGLNVARYFGWQWNSSTAGLKDSTVGNYAYTAKITFTIQKTNNPSDKYSGQVIFTNKVTVIAGASNPPGSWKQSFTHAAASQGAVTMSLMFLPTGLVNVYKNGVVASGGSWLESGQSGSDYEMRFKSTTASSWSSWTSLASATTAANIGAAAGTTSQASHLIEIRRVGQTTLYDSGTITLKLTNTASPR